MTLYEINAQLMALIDSAYDEETGEILDENLYEEVEALAEERDDKIEGIALWIKNLNAEATALKAEKEAFEKRQKAAENKAKKLKSFLQFILKGEKFKTAKVSISYRRSESVEVDKGFDIGTLDDRWLRFKEPELNKTEVKEALKAGAVIQGVSLVENVSMQIR